MKGHPENPAVSPRDFRHPFRGGGPLEPALLLGDDGNLHDSGRVGAVGDGPGLA